MNGPVTEHMPLTVAFAPLLLRLAVCGQLSDQAFPFRHQPDLYLACFVARGNVLQSYTTRTSPLLLAGHHNNCGCAFVHCLPEGAVEIDGSVNMIYRISVILLDDCYLILLLQVLSRRGAISYVQT